MLLHTLSVAQRFVVRPDGSSGEVFNSLNLPAPKEADSLSALRFGLQALHAMQQQGYLNATLSYRLHNPDTVVLWVHAGKPFRWLFLKPGNVPTPLLVQTGLNELKFTNRPFQYKLLMPLLENVIRISENSGYPFASVRYDSVRVEGEQFAATLDWQPGPFIEFGPLDVQGKVRVKPAWLAAAAGLRPGKPFSEKVWRQVPDRLAHFEFMTISATRILFRDGKATPVLEVEPRAASEFNGILGILPKSNGRSGTLLTGQIDLALANLFGAGRKLDIQWQRFQERSQRLQMLYVHPHIMNGVFGGRLAFGLLKEDSIFVNREGTIGAEAPVGSVARVSLIATWKSSDLLGTPSAEWVRSRNIADTRIQLTGLRTEAGKGISGDGAGWWIAGEAMAGPRRIMRNPSLPTSYYDSLPAQSLQTAGRLQARYQIMLSGRWRFYQRLDAGIVQGSRLFRNDLTRVGGLRTIRGFNENSFFVSRHVYSNVELRYYAEDDTYFGLFVDTGLLRVADGVLWRNEVPMSFGLTFNVNTKGGTLLFAFATGRTLNDGFHLDRAKVHFGYQARF
ncbi:MAG: hypothetical protein U0289_18455 [Cyclobacteriaceae bacterium]